MRRRRADYDRVDWMKSFAQIARELGVARQSVREAAERRGINPAAGHGGRRAGAGRKATA